MLKDFLDFLLNNINLGTFLIATLTFLITFATFFSNRASLKLIQLRESKSVVIKHDLIDLENPDVYWKDDYRLISDVIISNQSAKPISIVEFVLNDQLRFNSYNLPGKDYKVTTQPKLETKGGVTFSGTEKFLNYRVGDSWIQPIIDIPPHSSIRGHLFFHFANKEIVDIGTNKLDIITSRKTFTKDLVVFESQSTRLPLPSNILSVRGSFDF